MQLFLLGKMEKRGDQIFIPECKELLSQIRKVLRLSLGDEIAVQTSDGKRYFLEISLWDEDSLTGKVLKEESAPAQKKLVSLAVAMPNKWDKAELIVQKLGELGVDEIYFWPSERSVLKEWNEKKSERMEKILREAVEQSWGWRVPKLLFVKNISAVCEQKTIIVFDIGKTGKDISLLDYHAFSSADSKKCLGIVGPEGGLTSKDYSFFGDQIFCISLGETILRMETAAIVGARFLKQF